MENRKDRVEDFVLNSSFEILNPINPTSVAFKATGDGLLKKKQYNYDEKTALLMMDIKLFIHFEHLKCFEKQVQNEIEKNIKPYDEDTELNFALAENLNTIDINTVTREDPLSSQIIDDESNIFKMLSKIESRGKMKPEIFSSINDLCQQLKASDDYNALDEDDNYLYRDNGYPTDVVIPLIRAAIKDIPNFNYIRVTTSVMESKSSKERRKLQKCSSFGKKPYAMIIASIRNIEFEMMFLKGSRLFADKGKRHSDSVKLWRESNDGIWLASRGCKLKQDFAITNIQVFR
ncbi:hypothetical protein C1646_762794 [Rhizophagus diaphanus]|nr:hypothetical protein C1646_762794 [Rhizophagus diaphanus] [Rhizophagus sp. MUCL 43196]